MTARLPTPGQDDGVWGTILNDYLSQSHNTDGTLKPIDQSNITGLSSALATKANNTDLNSKADATALTSGLAAKANTSDLSPVATSGSYSDLTDKPTIPPAGAQALTPTPVKTAAYTAVAGDLVPVDASGASVIVTLPTAPPDKSKITIKKLDTSANAVTIQAGGSDVFNKAGGSTSVNLTLQNQGVSLQYAGSGGIWYVVGDDIPLTTLTTTYDARIGGSAFSAKAGSALQPWRAALAGRFLAPANVLVVGDSTDEGTGSGTLATDRLKSWPDRLGQLLRYRCPTPGETQGPIAPNYVPIYTDSSVPTGWTVGGGWAKQYTKGPSATTAFTSTAGSTLTYTIPVGVTSLDIVHVAGSSLTGWTYAIDGGSASATQTMTGLNRDGATVRLTGWTTNAAHSLVITSVGTNNYIDGAMLYYGNESAGIRVFNGAHHGSRSGLYLSTGSWTWLSPTVSPTTLAGVQSIIPVNPDLIIVGWGYNEINNLVPSATMQTNIATLVAAMRAMLPSKTISVIYLDKWLPGPSWVVGNAIEPWANYQSAMGALAAADPYGLHVSFASAMPQPGSAVATATSTYMDSGVHALAKGYSMAADTLASILAA